MQHFNSRISKLAKKPRQAQQKYNHFLVLDFEATCDYKKTVKPQEIIEFPVLKVNASSYEVESMFHQFVKPVAHPVLTDFCTSLTTITQEEVNSGKSFPFVLMDFDQWIKDEIGTNEKFLFVTCGDWDLKFMLPSQCITSNVDMPSYFNEWMNIKVAYSILTGKFSKGMMSLIKDLNLVHVGTHHRGLDDCFNIANILRALADLGCKFEPSNRHVPR